MLEKIKKYDKSYIVEDMSRSRRNFPFKKKWGTCCLSPLVSYVLKEQDKIYESYCI